MSPTLVSSNTDMAATRTQTAAAEGHARAERRARAGATRRMRREEAALCNGTLTAELVDATSPRADPGRASPLRAGHGLPHLLAASSAALPCCAASLHRSADRHAALPAICNRLHSDIASVAHPLLLPLSRVTSGAPLICAGHPRCDARTPTSR